MFEETEICLRCGKHLPDSLQAYCSVNCEGRDAASTPISSSSSAFPSPMVNCADGEEVPALVPSALGLALQHYSDGKRDSVSSSSASTRSWSTFEDDELDDNIRVEEDYSYQGDQSDSRDSMYDTSSQSSYTTKSTGLSYARRPSNTNNHSALSSPHTRTSSRMKLRHISQSVPGSSQGYGEDDSESASSPSADNETNTIAHRPKKVRVRGSLPNYFALLQMSTSVDSSHPPTEQPSSRPSPSTPKSQFALAAGLATDQKLPKSIWDIARGSSERDGATSNRSISSSPRNLSCVTRPRFLQEKLAALESSDADNASSQLFLGKGHETTDRGRPRRRNSSPPRQLPPSSTSRGRLRAEELDGRGCSPDAPGYGIGRSGLQNRTRERERDGTVCRGSFGIV